MSDPAEIRLACIGCGAMNPSDAEVCSGCGHRFRDPTPVLAEPDPMANPYEAPQTRVARAPTFQIGTAMIWIAVVALWMGAFAAGAAVGVLATLALLPATIRLVLVSARRSAEGRPMSMGDQALSFVGTVASSIVIGFSSIVAFGLTCFPMAGGGVDPLVSAVIGLGVALFVGGGFTYALVKANRLRVERERDRELIVWK
ncbi:hypothetical protein P12x_005087 [Tundrisphaera lichenicola]|uniref:hypothetical protein n=1 Tax=Tundrisphaera lichenicola TaxID=2029860 RepID=UPI003EB9B209